MVSYPENLKNNIDAVTEGEVRYLRPFLAFTDEKTVAKRLVRLCSEEWDIPAAQTRAAVHAAWEEQLKAKAEIRAEGKLVLESMEREGRAGIVLAGRPLSLIHI